MPIPSQTDFFSIVLPLYADGRQYSRRDIEKKTAKCLGLTDEERSLKTSSGKPVYASRAAWAVSYLSRANLITKVSRGVYEINDSGRTLLEEGLKGKRFSDRIQLIIAQENPWGKDDSTAEKNESSEEVELPDEGAVITLDKSPFEVIEDAINELNTSLSQELLKNILDREPAFFERLVVDLLEKMGYGVGNATQLSHDGGIDGIITTDSLGFDPIYTQAKRYSPDNRVGKPEMQAFAGALGRVSRGVFITTSSFVPSAAEFAKTYPHATIILIDGKRLTELMIKYDVGVSTERNYAAKRIDIDYFENDA